MDAGSTLIVQFNYTVRCHSLAANRNCRLGSILSVHYTVRIYTEVEVKHHLYFNICVICTWVDRYML